MAGHIPKDFIDQLMSRIDIVEIVNARVPLKKAGREYTACCPFHNEKTPSFTVSPTKQFYHCFGCGAHGTAISFLMDYEHLDYHEAIETLARLLSLDVPRENNNRSSANSVPSFKRPEQDELFQLMDEVRALFIQQLAESVEAQAYLKQRGLSVTVSEQYGLGFAPDQYHALTQLFGQRFGEHKLIRVGLQIKGDSGRAYDRFRGRLMFPIRDQRGQVTGFGGRILGEGKPKYLNSPETELFHKGQQLYGFYEARQHTRQLERLVVVEGYMDVIALAQFGITYAVATLGTATTLEHIGLLFRSVPEVVFCFDGDRAGREAAWRALEAVLPVLNDGREVRFLFLPTGEDPDTYVRKVGQAAFEVQLKEALPLTKFFILGLKESLGFAAEASLHVLEESARFSTEASRLLELMPDSMVRRALLGEVQRLGRVGAVVVPQAKPTAGVNSFGFKPTKDRAPWSVQGGKHRFKSDVSSGVLAQRPTDFMIQKTPVRYAIALLMHTPELANLVIHPEKLLEWGIAGLDLLVKVVEVIEEHPYIHSAGLLEQFRNSPEASVLLKLMAWEPATADNEVLKREFQDCLRQIRRQARQKALDTLLYKEQTQGLSLHEKHDLLSLLDELHSSPN